MTEAVFPGSFDPPTLGHANIIKRCLAIFSRLHVVVADNPNKTYSISSAQRLNLVQTLTKQHQSVTVALWNRLIVEYATKHSIPVIIRGVRPFGDFDFEFQLSMINKGLSSEVETLFIPTDPRYFVLRSSSIKELVRLGGDISTMVPTEIIDQVMKIYG